MKPSSIPRRDDLATFDHLFAQGAAAVLAGEHDQETTPEEGSRRWGVSALLRPDATAAAALEAMAHEAAALAGDGHWLTGTAHRSHLTMRALEWPRDEPVPADDPRLARYATALHTALTGIGPLGFEVFGLILTRVSVMACALPVDDTPDRFSAAFTAALGPDAWWEKEVELNRSIWYLNLLHFAAPIRRPRALVDWVTARRAITPIPVRIADAEITEWAFRDGAMEPVPLAVVPTAGAAPG